MTRKIFSFLAVGICICSLCSCSKPSQVEILSPDGQIKLNLSLNENGQPFYEVTVKDSLFITRSALGLTAKQEINLSEGFEIEKTVSDSKDEIWEQPWGENKTNRNHYNEMAIHLKNREKVRLTLRFRLFDDGIGFRYEYDIP